MSRYLPPENIAMADQRIAHAHHVLRISVKEFQKLRKELGDTDAIIQLVVLLHRNLDKWDAAIDLLAVAILELSDRQEGQ